VKNTKHIESGLVTVGDIWPRTGLCLFFDTPNPQGAPKLSW